jgi:hypothetical protein
LAFLFTVRSGIGPHQSNIRLKPAVSAFVDADFDTAAYASGFVEIISEHFGNAAKHIARYLSFCTETVSSLPLKSPAWRNWQTRWTQNPVAARPCGFEPLRRQTGGFSNFRANNGCDAQSI